MTTDNETKNESGTIDLTPNIEFDGEREWVCQVEGIIGVDRDSFDIETASNFIRNDPLVVDTSIEDTTDEIDDVYAEVRELEQYPTVKRVTVEHHAEPVEDLFYVDVLMAYPVHNSAIAAILSGVRTANILEDTPGVVAVETFHNSALESRERTVEEMVSVTFPTKSFIEGPRGETRVETTPAE